MPAPANPNILKQIQKRPVKPAATPDPFFKGIERTAGSIGHSLWNLAKHTNIAQAVQRKGMYSPSFRDTPRGASDRALLDTVMWPGALGGGVTRTLGATSNQPEMFTAKVGRLIKGMEFHHPRLGRVKVLEMGDLPMGHDAWPGPGVKVKFDGPIRRAIDHRGIQVKLPNETWLGLGPEDMVPVYNSRTMGAFGKPMPWFRNPLVQGAGVRAFKEGYYDPTHPRGR